MSVHVHVGATGVFAATEAQVARLTCSGTGRQSAVETDLREGTLGEDTASTLSVVARAHKGGAVRVGRPGVDLHEQTGLSAGAVTDNHELATDLGHFAVCRGSVGVSSGICGGAGRAER
jgi:hypothetical protein